MMNSRKITLFEVQQIFQFLSKHNFDRNLFERILKDANTKCDCKCHNPPEGVNIVHIMACCDEEGYVEMWQVLSKISLEIKHKNK